MPEQPPPPPGDTPPAPPPPQEPPAHSAPSTGPTPEPATDQAGSADGPSHDERLMAAGCHLGPWIGMPVLLAAVFYLTQKDKSPFVRFHAVQSMAFQLVASVAIAILSVGITLFVTITCGLGFPALFVLIAAALGLAVWDAWHGYLAYEGKWTEFPMLENLEQRLGLEKSSE